MCLDWFCMAGSTKIPERSLRRRIVGLAGNTTKAATAFSAAMAVRSFVAMNESLRARFPHASASFLRLNGATPEPAKPAAHAVTASKAERPTMRQNRSGPNKTEAAFLHFLHAQPGIRHQMREGITLKLGNGVRYTPDYTAEETDESHTVRFACYEVKGFMRDDAAAKLKIAASLFPLFRFYLVKQKRKKDGGGWSIEVVSP